ncbi:MAG: hypothetical protein IJ770_05700 [Alphaproteobacteria bacterium]|nr:hypothetical protein [Alphaproteobacteria bacterium]
MGSIKERIENTKKRLDMYTEKTPKAVSEVVADSIEIDNQKEFTECVYRARRKHGSVISTVTTDGKIISARQIKNDGKIYSVAVSDGSFSLYEPESHDVDISGAGRSATHNLYGAKHKYLPSTIITVEAEDKSKVSLVAYGYYLRTDPVSQSTINEWQRRGADYYVCQGTNISAQGVALIDDKTEAYESLPFDVDIKDLKSVYAYLKRTGSDKAKFFEKFVIVTDEEKAAFNSQKFVIVTDEEKAAFNSQNKTQTTEKGKYRGLKKIAKLAVGVSALAWLSGLGQSNTAEKETSTNEQKTRDSVEVKTTESMPSAKIVQQPAENKSDSVFVQYQKSVRNR